MEWISVSDRLPEKEILPKDSLRAYLVKGKFIYGIRGFEWQPGDVIECIGGFDGLSMTVEIIMFTDKQGHNCMFDVAFNGLNGKDFIEVTHWKPLDKDTDKKELDGI